MLKILPVVYTYTILHLYCPINFKTDKIMNFVEFMFGNLQASVSQ